MRLLKSVLVLSFVVVVSACEQPEVTKNFLYPPEDLYVPLGEIPLDLANPLAPYELEVRHKYPGRHAVEVRVQNPPGVGRPFEASFELRISVEYEEVEMAVPQINDPLRPFWGSSYGGLTVMNYSVPEDLPEGVPLKFLVTVTTHDQGFEDRYGSTTLVVQKMSDE